MDEANESVTAADTAQSAPAGVNDYHVHQVAPATPVTPVTPVTPAAGADAHAAEVAQLWAALEEARNGLLERVAEACHEANRVLRRVIGEDPEQPWAEAPEWQRASAFEGVRKIALGEITRPEQSHESWMAHKLADGWTWGPTKDPAKKEHDLLVPYDQLPPLQREKDALFFAIASALTR